MSNTAHLSASPSGTRISAEDYSRRYGELMASCMEDGGWKVSRAADGSISFHVPETQQDAYAQAQRACGSKIDTEFPAPKRERADLVALYDYQVGPLTQCLTRRGYPPTRSPESRSVWVETYLSSDGDAIGALYNACGSVGQIDPTKAQELQKACPQTPPGW